MEGPADLDEPLAQAAAEEDRLGALLLERQGELHRLRQERALKEKQAVIHNMMASLSAMNIELQVCSCPVCFYRYSICLDIMFCLAVRLSSLTEA